MANLEWVRQRYIYLVVLALLALMAGIILLYRSQAFTYYDARVYLEALTAMATLALLYFAYFNATAKKEEDAAHLELAVRPILVWELQPKGSGAQITYKTLKHPIYDFRATLRAGGKAINVYEKHLDVSEANPEAERTNDISKFVEDALGGEKSRTIGVEFAYHSEAGGKYVLLFTKEVARKGSGYLFEHRKFVSAKYPWRAEAVQFDGRD